MYPTLSHTGSYILHSPLSLRWPFASLFGNSPSGLPARGSLVTAISPLDPSHQVLKRVIGLPGDKVCVDPTGERRRTGPAGLGASADEWVTVPKGAVWLAGDNASNSTDSRDYGPVPLAMVKGGVVARVSSSRPRRLNVARGEGEAESRKADPSFHPPPFSPLRHFLPHRRYGPTRAGSSRR
ncbi:peptidase S24/S26A/S26B/S26C [Leucosporidium creatinivorum]|uniref:Mitochondrial inner membrane protease subunit n=1 Tax=Leucosporidium creatinivorum TaxID=106004 RepID=A0A1Y2FWW0_9BASI|nr:peptidase S24/S26A/S26B/S26C [Leucosporidium creatinivorum]